MPLSSSCLRAKKAFSGNLITLVAVQSVLKQPYYLIKIVKAYSILPNENKVKGWKKRESDVLLR